MHSKHIQQIALRTIELEAAAVSGLAQYIDESFVQAIQLIYKSKGRLVVSGIGKSAIIAQKIVATLNSTGTPALYMHAADAIHGDLGMVQQQDTVLIISKSGNSPEIKLLVSLIKSFGNPLLGMVENSASFLAKQADLVLCTKVEKEACPNNLAPTSSTTAQMVMGDAMAICLMELNNFTGQDFARFHPGGVLGKKLYMRVADLYLQNEKPAVLPEQSWKEVIVEMTRTRLGATCVVDNANRVLGIITDGDLRRMLEKNAVLDGVHASAIMTNKPKTTPPEELAIEALNIMRRHSISQLVVTKDDQYLGMIHVHDLLKEGLI
ncbi:MAG: KpsF/GutQ family sugar-phosphate isomerase [Williamsia sp.]|nr:KpsF/GutQ family sugar-phosphate isomerase [Williamsia sp.]